jgi:hypothetical protein
MARWVAPAIAATSHVINPKAGEWIVASAVTPMRSPTGRRAERPPKDTDLMAIISLFGMALDVISGEAKLI